VSIIDHRAQTFTFETLVKPLLRCSSIFCSSCSVNPCRSSPFKCLC